MQIFFEAAQPYLETIVLTIISMVAAMVAAALMEMRKRVLTWIESRTTKDQRELLEKLAGEGFAFAETLFRDAEGPQKLEAAMKYVSRRLSQRGLDITTEEIQAAIEKAVIEHNK